MSASEHIPQAGGSSKLAAATQQRAVVVVGHGSLRPGAGTDLVRLASHLSHAGAGVYANAAFLNLSRPTFIEALAHQVARGATEVIVVPYFLTFGHTLRNDLASLLNTARALYPQVRLRTTRPLGDHPAIARLLVQRAFEADYLHAHPFIAYNGHRRGYEEGSAWQPLCQAHPTALLIAAHGSPETGANQPIYAVARRVRALGNFAAVLVCFMHLNRPTLLEATDRLIARSIHNCIAAPYFLHPGNHVAVDLPTLAATARARHPDDLLLLLAEHLSFDRALVSVVIDRIAEASARDELFALHVP